MSLLTGLGFCLLPYGVANAAFASKFSLTVGELYTDNIFFSNSNKDHDFVTTVTPTFSFYYAPTGEAAPTLNLNFSPTAAIFARNSNLNNFGDGFSLNGGYTYRYSPRLEFHISDTLNRQGKYRLGPLSRGILELPSAPGSPPPSGGTLPGQDNRPLSDFTKGGSTISNNLFFQGTYRYKEGTSLTASYSNRITKYLSRGGTDIAQQIGVRGVYDWGQGHNLHAGYSVTYYSPRDGDSSVIHNFDFGDSYFASEVIPLTSTASLTMKQGLSVGTRLSGTGANILNVELTPTLNLAASTGLSINTSNDGPRVANSTNITVTKIWEKATLAGVFQHGLTPSYGVSGISTTTSISSRFNMSMTERLTTLAGVSYSFYDTDDGNFSTFQASLGLQYLLNAWLSSNLSYNYRWADSDKQAARSSNRIIEKGVVRSNSVYLTLTAYFDLWPNFGLANPATALPLSPIVRSPFPQTRSASPLRNP